MDINIMLNNIEGIIYSACDLFLNNGINSFKHKSTNDILTDTDINMQSYLIMEIKKLYPTISFISEEKDNQELSDELTICIDPLDGTCNFSLGLTMFGVQMAIFENKNIIASIIYLPYYKKLFKTIKGNGVTLNGKRIFLNKDIKQTESILLLSDFYPKIDISFEKQLKLVHNLQSHFLKIRLFGAACFDFATLATSKAQAYICYYNEIWDIAPGLLMIEELGMKYSGFYKPYKLNDSALIVALNDEILNDIKNTFFKI